MKLPVMKNTAAAVVKLTVAGTGLWWLAMGVTLVPAQESASAKVSAGTQETASSQEEAMKKWMAFITPGTDHELLKYKVGKWKMQIEMWTAPGAPPTVSEGTSEGKLIMGGRYLLDETRSTLQGNAFEGMGITGYDNLKKRFVSVWIDNLGTGFTISSGTYDESSKTYNYTTMTPDVMVGDYKRTRTVERIEQDDQWVVEMYDTTADGQEFLMMKAVYTRMK